MKSFRFQLRDDMRHVVRAFNLRKTGTARVDAHGRVRVIERACEVEWSDGTVTTERDDIGVDYTEAGTARFVFGPYDMVP